MTRQLIGRGSVAWCLFLALACGAGAEAELPGALPGTTLLSGEHDFAMEMVAGIGSYLDALTEREKGERARYWKRDLSSPEAYTASVEVNRERFKTIMGAVESRVAPNLEIISAPGAGAVLAEASAFKVFYVRWQVVEGVTAEGLLLEPKRPSGAACVALPDCDVSPEQFCGLAPGAEEDAQIMAILTGHGIRILVPTLLNREDTFSGRVGVQETNQPHREYIYRAAFELGRHVIGYEVQKVQAAVDWLSAQAGAGKVGVVGYGEGGLIALYAAAVDTRISAAVVSGYFGPRERLWSEPIYRNVFGLLKEFGDAEIASLIAPRSLFVEGADAPKIDAPPAPRAGRQGAAPGAITTTDADSVKAEVVRAQELTKGLSRNPTATFVKTTDGRPEMYVVGMLSYELQGDRQGDLLDNPLPSLAPKAQLTDSVARQGRQVAELMAHVQGQLREAQYTRADFWKKADATSVASWERSTAEYRTYLWDEIIGRLPDGYLPANARARQIYDEPAYTGYEVQLDVVEGIFAYGILLVPKGIAPGEKRAVVVCQHGLEGRPDLLTKPGTDDHYYHRFAGQLAEKGYITFSPQNPYIGEDKFRVLQRKLNPLKMTLFSVITAQHECILNWLGSLPMVDAKRMGFYGLSYGGKTAMRVPVLLPQYAFSICSGDFNEWIWKNASDRSPYSYLFNCEYEIFEWNLGNTFNYAEMSWLICPRPFMVERGHQDGVAPDEWVGYEYARTRSRYDQLGVGERTELEYFNGPHTIHGVGTFAFIDKVFGGPKGRP